MINAGIVPGAAIVTGIEQGIYADAEQYGHFAMHNDSSELSGVWVDFDCPMQSVDLRSVADSESYFAYAAGVASYIKDHYTVGGVRITIKKMTLPMKKGLSSSAAICVLVARAFNRLYGLNLSTRGEMDIAFKGEQRTRSRCGRLDQACAFGTVPVCMRFDGDDIEVERLIVKEKLYWVFADLNAQKDTIKILSDLNKCYPFAETETERKVHEALGERNRAIIGRAIEYLRRGDAHELGKLMTEAQALFDAQVAPASAEQLAAPRLHAFLNDETVKALTFGGKGVGSQGDGSVQFLAKDAVAQERLYGYLEERGLSPYKLTINPRRRIRKAVIPLAGYGTRLYPATRRMKKEMMPLIDQDGMVKPAILVLLDQLYEAGIEEICLVAGDGEDVRIYQDYFQTPLAVGHLEKLSEGMRAYEEKIRSIGERVTYRTQHERRGFGHAVYQCRDFSAGEPVVLLLGDTVYSSTNEKNCTWQLIEAYEALERPLVAIHAIPLEAVRQYGVLSGVWEDPARSQMSVSHFVEKPDPVLVEQELGVMGPENSREYYGVFGQYVLTPEVFDALQKAVEGVPDRMAEIGMTEALASFIGKGLTGVVLDGAMYDIGNPSAYRETVAGFGAQ
jgi:UTP-glucose-1-phosphate uridylyltransferase/mevalonate kinase